MENITFEFENIEYDVDFEGAIINDDYNINTDDLKIYKLINCDNNENIDFLKFESKDKFIENFANFLSTEAMQC